MEVALVRAPGVGMHCWGKCGGGAMPTEEFYTGLSLKEKLRRFADHHYEQETRHISRYEYEMLLEAARLLPDEEVEGTQGPC